MHDAHPPIARYAHLRAFTRGSDIIIVCIFPVILWAHYELINEQLKKRVMFENDFFPIQATALDDLSLRK